MACYLYLVVFFGLLKKRPILICYDPRLVEGQRVRVLSVDKSSRTADIVNGAGHRCTVPLRWFLVPAAA